MDEYTKRSEERRHEYQRRWRQALKDGGRGPDESEWNYLLGRARDLTQAEWARRTKLMKAETRGELLTPLNKESPEWLPPGHVAVSASVVLGLEAALNEVKASREVVEQHRMALLGLISKAQVPPAAGDPDLFRLETALETGRDLSRDADKQLLEAVRELIRWRAAAQVQAAKSEPRSGE